MRMRYLKLQSQFSPKRTLQSKNGIPLPRLIFPRKITRLEVASPDLKHCIHLSPLICSQTSHHLSSSHHNVLQQYFSKPDYVCPVATTIYHFVHLSPFYRPKVLLASDFTCFQKIPNSRKALGSGV